MSLIQMQFDCNSKFKYIFSLIKNKTFRYFAVYSIFVFLYFFYHGDTLSVFYPGWDNYREAIGKITEGGFGSQLFIDLSYSMMRFLCGIALASFIAFIFAVFIVNTGFIRWFIDPLLITLYKIPFLSLFPILLFLFGTGELSKILIIFTGLFPFFSVELIKRTDEHLEYFSNTLNLLKLRGWRKWYYFDFLGLLKYKIELIGQSFTPAWLFLIVAETSGVRHGIGYRIFLSQRFLKFSEIILYVICLTIVSVLLYAGIRKITKILPTI